MRINSINFLILANIFWCNLFATNLDQSFFNDAMSLRIDQVFNTKDLTKSSENIKYSEIDLSDVDFSTENGTKIIDRFVNLDISGVRVINIQNAKNVDLFFQRIFDCKETIFPFVSLRLIRAENSDINPSHVKKLHHVLSSFPFYVRDFKECYARHNVWAILLKIKVSSLFQFQEENFINGMYAEESEKLVGYRSDGVLDRLPFITYVGRN
ncbi:MAG: hypothetical protein HEEMFOPI_01930 [Holosporales bacterium]